MIIRVSDDGETPCPKSPDGQHCENHWYDDEGPCCYCGDNGLSMARGWQVVDGDNEPDIGGVGHGKDTKRNDSGD